MGGSVRTVLPTDGVTVVTTDAGLLGLDPVMTSESTTPVFITSDAEIIASGYMGIFYIDDVGALWAQGENFFGMLGTGNQTSSSSFIRVHGVGNVGLLANIASIDAGGDNAIAISNFGTVYSWGGNGNGEAGTGQAGDQYTPVVLDLIP